MFRQLFILFLCLAGSIYATLVQTFLINSPHPLQRFNWSEAYEHLRGNLFDQCWDISKSKIRNQTLETWLIAIADAVWNRAVFFEGVDSLGLGYSHWIKKYGKAGSSPGRFQHPRGVVIDTSVYTNQPENYFIYIADRYNNRFVRLFYNGRYGVKSSHSSIVVALWVRCFIGIVLLLSGQKIFVKCEDLTPIRA